MARNESNSAHKAAPSRNGPPETRLTAWTSGRLSSVVTTRKMRKYYLGTLNVRIILTYETQMFPSAALVFLSEWDIEVRWAARA